MNILETKGFIIGMVHLDALPGSASFKDNCSFIIERALEDAKTLESAGVDAIMVENMGDLPFTAKLNKSQVAALSCATALVKNAVKIPVGVDAAFNDAEAAISIAKFLDLDFVRIPVFVDTVLFTDGIIYPSAHECMTIKRNLNANKVKILADVQVKHSHMLSNNISIEQSAKEALSCGADAIIVTGTQIGEETPLDLIKRVKKVVNIPVIAGSGIDTHNIKEQFAICDGAIVGSSLKEGGVFTNKISYDKTLELVKAKN